MGDGLDIISSQEVVERIARQGSQENAEKCRVTSPGARTVAWAAIVTEHYDYNVYYVRTVSINAPGTYPTEMGQPVLATNLAEPFLSQGQLPEDTYVAMLQVGDKNVFYAPV